MPRIPALVTLLLSTALVTSTAPTSAQTPVAPPQAPAAGRGPAASGITTMEAALDEIQRLWAGTRPSTGMFSADWHVQNILYALRNSSAAGAMIQLNAARTSLAENGGREVDLLFLDVLEAVAAAQLGQRPEVTRLVGGAAQGAYAAQLKPLTQFLQAYQPAKTPPAAASAPAPTRSPAPAAKAGGPLVPGDYSCWLERPGLYGARNDVPQGTLTLRPNGTYTYRGSSGSYRHNAASGAITFTGGFFTNPTPERTTWVKHQTTAQIDIHWAYANDWSCGMNL